jgi:putative endonuclease
VAQWWKALRKQALFRKPSLASQEPEPAKPEPAKPEPTESAKLGIWGENLAAEHLKSSGYQIAAQRVRIGRDEIDLIALSPDKKRPEVVFVEVKTRRSPDFGGPMAALTKRKRHALRRAASGFLRRLPPPTRAFRFDVVEVIGEPGSAPPLIRHTRNVFTMRSDIVAQWISRDQRPR